MTDEKQESVTTPWLKNCTTSGVWSSRDRYLYLCKNEMEKIFHIPATATHIMVRASVDKPASKQAVEILVKKYAGGGRGFYRTSPLSGFSPCYGGLTHDQQEMLEQITTITVKPKTIWLQCWYKED